MGDDEPRSRMGSLFRLTAVASLLGLVGLVAFVGAVGVLADYMNTWEWFFRLEQLAALSAPLAVVLLALSIAGWLGVVYESS